MQLILAVQFINKVAWRFWTDARNFLDKKIEFKTQRTQETKMQRTQESKTQRTQEFKTQRTQEFNEDPENTRIQCPMNTANPRPKEHNIAIKNK